MCVYLYTSQCKSSTIRTISISVGTAEVLRTTNYKRNSDLFTDRKAETGSPYK